MEKHNVGGWRYESDSGTPDTTARLLQWLGRVSLGTAMTVEEVAAEVCGGLCELVEARYGLMLTREAGRDVLSLSATTVPGFQSLLRDFETTQMPVRSLLSVLPQEAFFVNEAAPALQVLTGELWDTIRDAALMAHGGASTRSSSAETSSGTASTREASDTLPSTMPQFLVPLRSGRGVQSEQGETAEQQGDVTGLALLWTEGPLSGALQPVLSGAATQAGGWIAEAMAMDRVTNSYRTLGLVFANAIDAKDQHRIGHSRDVAYYASVIARGLHLPDYENERVEFAGLLHDIGKIAVPDTILKKKTSVTMDELEMIRQSTVTGAEWIAQVDGLQEVALMIRHQNERYDGGGYPDGLSGQAIPLGARILAVATRFSAMTKPRPDRRALSVVGGALEALAAESGTTLDPRVVNTFLTAMGRTL